VCCTGETFWEDVFVDEEEEAEEEEEEEEEEEAEEEEGDKRVVRLFPVDFTATTALLVDVPSWADRQALIAKGGA
jgi:hypothetical protein